MDHSGSCYYRFNLAVISFLIDRAQNLFVDFIDIDFDVMSLSLYVLLLEEVYLIKWYFNCTDDFV